MSLTWIPNTERNLANVDNELTEKDLTIELGYI